MRASPPAMVSTITVPLHEGCCGQGTKRAPLMRLASSVTFTSLAAVLLLLVRVANSLKRSPLRTTLGSDERHVEVGVADQHAALGRAHDVLGADRQPLEHGRDVEVERVEPSCSPRTRNSAWPCCSGASTSTSSDVPGSPSAPTPFTGSVEGAGPLSSGGSASGSSALPGTRSGPGGSLILAVTLRTERPEPAGAPLATRSCAEKNCFR